MRVHVELHATRRLLPRVTVIMMHLDKDKLYRKKMAQVIPSVLCDQAPFLFNVYSLFV